MNKKEILESIDLMFYHLERDLEWPLTDSITTKEAKNLLQPLTDALLKVYNDIENLEMSK